MPNPTSKHNRARRDKRRANWKLSTVGSGLCPECQEPKLPHKVCLHCGTYNGKKILEVIEKETA